MALEGIRGPVCSSHLEDLYPLQVQAAAASSQEDLHPGHLQEEARQMLQLTVAVAKALPLVAKAELSKSSLKRREDNKRGIQIHAVALC